MACNIYLEPTLDESCDCIDRGKAIGLKVEKYNDEDKDIIPIIKAIHRYVWHGVSKGGKKSRKQTKTNVLIGPKGGKYKLIKGRRVYIGGNGDFRNPTGGFVESFVAFIKEIVLDAVASYRRELLEAIVVDDGSENVMVRYIFKAMGYDMSNLFMVERGIVIDAWHAHTKPAAERTDVETNALGRFITVVDGFRTVILAAA